MSEIQVGQINSTDGSTAITTSSGNTTVANNLTVTGGFVPSTQIGGRRNLIINGAMQVAQRGTSQSISYSTLFPVDRMEMGFGSHAQLAGTVSQSTTAPNGFSNSVKLDVTTAETSLDSGEGVTFRQKFEGQDLQQIAKGTADAKQVTLSFWVRSSQTGTYIAELYDNDNTRQVSKSYTVDTADTWEHKTITFPADTTGAFDNDNNLSLYVFWWLAAGSAFTSGTLNDDAWAAATNADRAVGQTNLIGSVNDWYVTGVQLEVGIVATPFEHRSYGEELTLCERYFQILGAACGRAYGSTAAEVYVAYRTRMRATPSGTLRGAGNAVSDETGNAHISGISGYDLSAVNMGPASTTGATIEMVTNGSWSTGSIVGARGNPFNLDAEL